MKKRSRKETGLLITAAILALMTLPVAAAEETEEPWQFGVGIPLWAPSIDGNVTLRGRQQDVSIGFDQLKDHLDASFSLALDIHKGKFGLFSTVGYMKFSGEKGFERGGHASSELKFAIVNAGLSYLLVKTEGERPFLLEGTAGIRYWYASADLTVRDEGGTTLVNGGEHKNLVDPVIGLRASQYILPKLHVDVLGDVGGFNISYDTDITWSAAGVVTYDFFKWFSLSAGYSALGLNVENGSGTSKKGFDLTFHGPEIVAKLKF